MLVGADSGIICASSASPRWKPCKLRGAARVRPTFLSLFICSCACPYLCASLPFGMATLAAKGRNPCVFRWSQSILYVALVVPIAFQCRHTVYIRTCAGPYSAHCCGVYLSRSPWHSQTCGCFLLAGVKEKKKDLRKLQCCHKCGRTCATVVTQEKPNLS